MSLIGSDQFLQWVELKKKDSIPKQHPFDLPMVRNLGRIEFHRRVTFIVGENGSGKSTLLEGISVAWGFNAEGGSKNFSFATSPTHSELHGFLRLARGTKRPTDGFFLRAESFYNVATYVEGLGVSGYGKNSLHEQSHGESFLALFMNRFRGNGLYILDEPEAALSPSRQLALLVRLHQLAQNGSQFIIATHSPLIMAYPDALIYQVNENGFARVKYEETEHFNLTKRFLNDPKRYLRELFRE